MEKTTVCPCPKLECPNHGDCEKCTSRHLRLGYLNYCGFYAILPFMEEVIAASPDSLSAQKLKTKSAKQLQAYAQLKEKHNISEEMQNESRAAKKRVSDH